MTGYEFYLGYNDYLVLIKSNNLTKMGLLQEAPFFVLFSGFKI